MNLIDAHKSGKRYKLARGCGTFYRSRGPDHFYRFPEDEIAESIIPLKAVFSDDWELETEPSISLTKSKILEVIAKIAKENMAENKMSILGPHGPTSIDSMYGMELLLKYHDKFLKELGL